MKRSKIELSVTSDSPTKNDDSSISSSSSTSSSSSLSSSSSTTAIVTSSRSAKIEWMKLSRSIHCLCVSWLPYRTRLGVIPLVNRYHASLLERRECGPIFDRIIISWEDEYDVILPRLARCGLSNLCVIYGEAGELIPMVNLQQIECDKCDHQIDVDTISSDDSISFSSEDDRKITEKFAVGLNLILRSIPLRKLEVSGYLSHKLFDDSRSTLLPIHSLRELKLASTWLTVKVWQSLSYLKNLERLSIITLRMEDNCDIQPMLSIRHIEVKYIDTEIITLMRSTPNVTSARLVISETFNMRFLTNMSIFEQHWLHATLHFEYTLYSESHYPIHRWPLSYITRFQNTFKRTFASIILSQPLHFVFDVLHDKCNDLKPILECVVKDSPSVEKIESITIIQRESITIIQREYDIAPDLRMSMRGSDIIHNKNTIHVTFSGSLISCMKLSNKEIQLYGEVRISLNVLPSSWFSTIYYPSTPTPSSSSSSSSLSSSLSQDDPQHDQRDLVQIKRSKHANRITFLMDHLQHKVLGQLNMTYLLLSSHLESDRGVINEIRSFYPHVDIRLVADKNLT